MSFQALIPLQGSRGAGGGEGEGDEEREGKTKNFQKFVEKCNKNAKMALFNNSIEPQFKIFNMCTSTYAIMIW